MPLPRAEHALEMLDRPAPPGEIERNLAELARLNRLFGGHRITLCHVRRLLARLPHGRTATILDVGTGAADHPVALARWARRARRPLFVVALDRDPTVLRTARRAAAAYPEIAFVQGDALDLPVRPESVDVVISALTLHHFEPEAAVRHLAEMAGAARVGGVVNDLARSRVTYAGVWVATRLLTRSAMGRHDGPLSVLRAYTPREVRALCEKAGLLHARVLRYRKWLRHCVVWEKR